MTKYRLFVQDVDLYLNMEEFLYSEVDHFFYTQRVDKDKFIDNLNRIRVFFKAFNCEISQDRGDHVWRIRPGRQNAAPVWRLDSGDMYSLVAMLDEQPETIFIQSFVPNPGYRGSAQFNYFGRENWRGKIFKEFLEIKFEYPGVEFIIFGQFDFRVYFNSGFDGGCIRPRTYNPNKLTNGDFYKTAPDGMQLQNSPLKNALIIASRYRQAQINSLPGLRRKVIAHLLRSVMMMQATADYQEQIRGVEFKQEYDAIKYLPKDFFPEDVNRPTKLLPRELPLLSQALPGDKILCDSCSLKYRCPVYKPESVCIVAESDGKALSDFFGSRNSDDVLKGLSAILQKQAERVEGAVTQEEAAQKKARDAGETVLYSDQVTKMLEGLQRNGDKYLRLVDPRFTKPVVQINQGGLPTGPVPRDIDPLAAREELVELGMPRDQITAEHIERYLEGTWSGPNEMRALENGQTIDGEIGF